MPMDGVSIGSSGASQASSAVDLVSLDGVRGKWVTGCSQVARLVCRYQNSDCARTVKSSVLSSLSAFGDKVISAALTDNVIAAIY